MVLYMSVPVALTLVVLLSAFLPSSIRASIASMHSGRPLLDHVNFYLRLVANATWIIALSFALQLRVRKSIRISDKLLRRQPDCERHKRALAMNYLFRGTVLIPHGQIKSEQVHVVLRGAPDYPGGTLRVAIRDNAVIAGFETPGRLTEVGIATLRNIVRDVATTLCRCFAVIEGTWARASVDSFTVEDGPQVMLNDISGVLKGEFEKYGITAADVIRVTECPDGYYLRNAIDNIAVGLMEPKFARVQFHCAVEALRNSMAPDRNEKQQWEIFRNALQVTRAEIETLVDNALRHGNYRDATPLSSAEADAVLSFLGRVVCKYVEWFKSTKLSPDSSKMPLAGNSVPPT